MQDRFGRTHTDLRISVTDRCNIRCSYCMPETGARFLPASGLLTFDEIVRFVEAAIPLGIRKIRLTGGEPLLRSGLPELIARLAEFREIEDLALTTNAVLLAQHATSLFAAGLRRLNVHLDTLNRRRFQAITRRDDLPRVLEGLTAATAAGFRRIKLNAVAMQGLSEPDLVPLVTFGQEHGFTVRFIEFMPLDGQRLWNLDQVLTADRMLAILAAHFGPLSVVPGQDRRAPATEYQLPDGTPVGFIASVSRPFCGDCNRLRLTADGHLRNCLFAREETPVRHLLTGEIGPGPLQAALRESVAAKWIGHEIQQVSFIAPARPMYAIGG